jgi:hypothetical protein
MRSTWPANSWSSAGSTYFLSLQMRRLRHSGSRPVLNMSSIRWRSWAEQQFRWNHIKEGEYLIEFQKIELDE